MSLSILRPRRPGRASARFACMATSLLLALGAAAASLQETRISGTFMGFTTDGSKGEGTFECQGEPTCIGTYQGKLQEANCSNTYQVSGRMRMTGMDLARTGFITVVIELENFGGDNERHADGTCSLRPNSGNNDDPFPMYGMFDGTTATVAGQWDDTDDFGRPQHVVVTSTFTATRNAPPPVFPMTVTASITETVASAEAQIQFRPQDVGKEGKVFVFAVAPASRVRNATTLKSATSLGLKSRPRSKVESSEDCVLAQLSPTGQLTAASASSLASATSGVLSAQGASVQIMNNVATQNVQGATFYVGYGESANAMIQGGVNRSALTVPGDHICQPQPPTTGWWWNPAEPGRGYSVEINGHAIFFASFLYDASGRSTWYVATGPASLDGAYYTGPLYSFTNGQTLGGAYPGRPVLHDEGTVTLAFGNDGEGMMSWPGGTVPLRRFDIVTGGAALDPSPDRPENGWWWNEAESGRGFFMEWQGGVADIAGYMYDDQGNPVWYLGWIETPPASMSLSGNWWSFGNGQTLTGAWRQNTLVNDYVAPVTVQFTSRTTAVMTLPNGRTTNLTRHRFGE